MFTMTLFMEVGVTTLALGSRPRQRGCKVAGQEEGNSGVKARAIQGCGPRGSPGVTSHTLGSAKSARECEGVNTHTPKATPTLGEGIPMDFQNFIERFEGSKLNGLWRSLYQWKALGT
jgi:Na+-translocating ferredoxin:NAD+ oxidoreductase RnfG subunit